METAEYTVSSLVNTTCKTKLQNALDKIEGVQEVAIDIGRGWVGVQYNEPATQDIIRTCIENTGYPVE